MSLVENNNLRQVATFNVQCQQFLVEVFDRAAANGLIHPSEMVLAGHTYAQLKAAQVVQLQTPSEEAPTGAAPVEGSDEHDSGDGSRY